MLLHAGQPNPSLTQVDVSRFGSADPTLAVRAVRQTPLQETHRSTPPVPPSSSSPPRPQMRALQETHRVTCALRMLAADTGINSTLALVLDCGH